MYERDHQADHASYRPGGLLMAVDVDPHEQFAAWGLVPKEIEGQA